MRRHCWAMLLCVAAGMVTAGNALAQREASEAGVKAAFLYKFANYIEWPAAAWASPTAPLVVGVLGADEIASELERIAPGRSVNGHPVVVKRWKQGEGVRGLHMLFVGKEYSGTPALLRAAQQQEVLTITEAERGLELGSAINFVTTGERVGFEVNLDSAEKSGHRISSRMLTVARRVVPKS